MPPLPPLGSTDWYAWAQAVQGAANDVDDRAQVAVGAIVVVHGDDAFVSRPPVTVPVLWIGSVQPTNWSATHNDTYLAATPAE